MKVVQNLLLIAGTGRNTGKTTLSCKIINRFSTDNCITGLKISPHFHGGTESLRTIVRNDNFNIYEETSSSSGKDSSLMLKAGAAKVFYIEVLDEYLEEAFDAFTKIAPPSCPIVCESPALRNYIIPGVFFIVDNTANKNKKTEILRWKASADKWIDTGTENISIISPNISIRDNKWTYN